VGPRDIINNKVEVARRDSREKQLISTEDLPNKVIHLLSQIQDALYIKANEFLQDRITNVDTWEEFKTVLENKGGFISAHWDGTVDTELKIKEETKATIRCIPMNNRQESGKCVLTGNPSRQRVLFARAY
jgi:prolyl-tRNA synthetase